MIISPDVINKIVGIVFTRLEPHSKVVIWAKPDGDYFGFYIYDNGEWHNMSEYENVTIPVISVNLSDFNNDVGYLTSANFKTINNESIVGEGNITIEGGGDIQVIKVNNVPLTPDENHAVNIDLSGYATSQDLSGKQDVIDSSHKLSADLVQDGTTNKVYTSTEQSKLSGIAAGAEVNVQANWSETDTGSDAYIQNKPTTSYVTFRVWSTT